MARTVRRILIAVILAGGFIALLVSVYVGNDTLTSRIIIAVWCLLGLGIIVGAIRRAFSARRTRSAQNPAPDDPIQSMLLGRKPPTFYQTSVDASSQIAPAPHPEPIDLPDDPDRYDASVVLDDVEGDDDENRAP